MVEIMQGTWTYVIMKNIVKVSIDVQPGKQNLRGQDNFPQECDVFEEMVIKLCTKQNWGQWLKSAIFKKEHLQVQADTNNSACKKLHASTMGFMVSPELVPWGALDNVVFRFLSGFIESQSPVICVNNLHLIL